MVERVAGADLKFDLARIAAVARETDARLVWICDPNNPTGGRGAGRLDALPRLLARAVCGRRRSLCRLCPAEERTPRLADVAAGRPVIVCACSRSFALAGLRLGDAIAHPELVPTCTSVQEPFNVNGAALAAGCATLADPSAYKRVGTRRSAAASCSLSCFGTAGWIIARSSGKIRVVSLDGRDDVAVADRVARRGIWSAPAASSSWPATYE